MIRDKTLVSLLRDTKHKYEVYLKGSNFREKKFWRFFFQFFFLNFANRAFRDFSGELIFANEKIPPLLETVEMKEKLAVH